MSSLNEGSRGNLVVKATKKKDGEIKYFLIDEQSQSAFVATDKDIINQINLRSQKITKQYSNLKLGSINCLSSFDNLLCVTGRNSCFTLINIPERRVLTIQPVKTRIKYMSCSQFTIINRNNCPTLVLIVSGGNP